MDITIIDSHVHLDRYTNEQCLAMLNRAAKVGVRTILTVGVDVPSSKRVIELAQQFGASHGVLAAVGLHPAFMTASPRTEDYSIDSIAQLAHSESERVVAIGEIGLDTIDGRASLDFQASMFREQLLLAHQQGLPIVLHVQGAEAKALAHNILATEGIGAGVVVHYFTGDTEEARRWLDLGCYISVGRPVTKATETIVRSAIARPDLPLERILVETDTYPYPGRKTEPADVVGVVEAVAMLKQISVREMAEQIMVNFQRIFHLFK
jgi:TatD DNase family protein